jgi:hypothetical protein
MTITRNSQAKITSSNLKSKEDRLVKKIKEVQIVLKNLCS